MMLASIVLPLVLNITRFCIETPSYIFGRNKWTCLLKLLLFPIFPIILKLKEMSLVQASRSYQVPINELEETKYHVSKFIQGDLGLESHFQIIFHIVLLLLATSETRTETGFEVLFKNEALFYLPTNWALGLSITWSIYTCISSHMKGVSKRRSYSTTRSYLTLLVYTSSSIVIRVFSCILFLTPGLGLFHILRHLQGEMYPFYQPLKGYVEYSSDTFYYGENVSIPWSQITRWNYIGWEDAEPPQQTLYTKYSSEEYFYILIGIFVCNVLLQVITKRCTNPKIFQKMTFFDCLIHAISCCLIPYPMEEWDEGKGSIEMHRLRKRLVFKEMVSSMMLNFAINLFLLSPLIILSTNIFARHELLSNTIGTFPKEDQAFLNIKLMLAFGYTFLVLLTIVQVVSYYLCNGRFHAFTMIVMS